MVPYFSADKQYNDIVNDVLQNGTYSMDRTGTGTLKLTSKVMRFYPAKSFPFITTKPMDKLYKLALGELFWIYQDQSRDVDLLRIKYGVNIWNKWARPNGSIGKAYGYQVQKHNQIDRLIEGIITNPNSRRHRIQLWSEEDARDMELEPCAFMTMWTVSDDTLDMTLIQRSADLGLGVPFNMAQYATLHMMIARATGYKVGEFVHFLQDAHIYVDHINPLRKQMQRTPRRRKYNTLGGTGTEPTITLPLSHATTVDEALEYFYSLQPKDIAINDLECHERPVRMQVSV